MEFEYCRLNHGRPAQIISGAEIDLHQYDRIYYYSISQNETLL